jgi:glycosyltransferase involved in cell wall biosynthesis
VKIDLFSPFAPIMSGVVTYAEDLAAALEMRGIEVNRVQRSFWPSWRLGLPGIYSKPAAWRFDRALTLAVGPLYTRPENTKHTISHFHVSGGTFNYPVVKHFHHVQGRRVITVHDQNFVTPSFRHPYDEVEQLRMLRASDLVIVHTRELEQRLSFINPNIAVLGHGVCGQRFAIDPAEARQRLGIRGPVVSHIGFLFNHKGIENLIKAVSQVQATILVVGSGPDDEQIRRLANFLCPGKIIFRPHADDDEYPYYIAASDIIVFPRIHSQGECSGVLVQAMAAGKAIVAHNLGCFKELLAPDRGILTEPENIAELTAAIAVLLDDAALRSRYGAACRDFAHNTLEWSLIADRHIELYSQLGVGD